MNQSNFAPKTRSWPTIPLRSAMRKEGTSGGVDRDRSRESQCFPNTTSLHLPFQFEQNELRHSLIATGVWTLGQSRHAACIHCIGTQAWLGIWDGFIGKLSPLKQSEFKHPESLHPVAKWASFFSCKLVHEVPLSKALRTAHVKLRGVWSLHWKCERRDRRNRFCGDTQPCWRSTCFVWLSIIYSHRHTDASLRWWMATISLVWKFGLVLIYSSTLLILLRRAIIMGSD